MWSNGAMRCLIAALLVLAACRSIDVEVRSLSTRRYPPGDPKQIQFFSKKTDVPRAFEELAIVSYHAMNPGADDIRRRMRQEAAKLGADALIWMRGCGLVYGPFGLGHQLDGWVAAIRYVD